MKKTLLIALITTSLIASESKAQLSAGPYKVRNSEEFESPKGHRVLNPIPYGTKGIIQVNARGMKSFNFQLFSNDLKFQKENTVEVENKFNEDVNFPTLLKLKNKTYLFVREVFRETKTEGITALEFSPEDLNFVGKSKNLFRSSDKVRSYSAVGLGYTMALGADYNSAYDLIVSDDETKFMYSYALVPKERRDKLNKDIIGMYVFDENLNKLWGDEFEMPYTEAKMDNLGYTLGNDGTIYLLAKVYEGSDPKEGRDKKIPNYHFEICIYNKSTKQPKTVEIKLDNYFPKSAYIYEDAAHNIVISGFYGKAANKPVDGAFMVKLNVASGTISKVNGGYYEIPADIIKSFTSEREKRKMERKEEKDEDNDIGVDNLQIREIYIMPDATTKIVAEQYVVRQTTYYDAGCKCTRTKYDTYADDIFVLSIDANGKLGWVKKIPKSQHSGDAAGQGLSINTYVTGNDLHIFYIDNIKNINLPENEAPKRHENGRGGYLTAVTIGSKGNIEKYSLGEIETYDTNFYIREFVDGENSNLISTERKRKKNILFSIDIK